MTPRTPDIDGIDHPKTLSYLDVLRDEVPVGKTVAVIGAGGIGHDVSEYLVERHAPPSIDRFFRTWGVDPDYRTAGGRTAPQVEPAERQVFLMQRSTGKVGERLGRTTGWIHRAALKMHGVVTASGVAYRRIDDDGLHVTIDGAEKTLPVDHVVICAGQEPLRDLQDDLLARGCSVHLIGGADVAAELDAKRAIDQGVRLAAAL